MYIGILVACMSMWHVHAVLLEARRECQNLWSWIYIYLHIDINIYIFIYGCHLYMASFHVNAENTTQALWKTPSMLNCLAIFPAL